MGKSVSYSVKATQRETVLCEDGCEVQAKGTTIYLGYDNSGGGWPQWGTDVPFSTPWESADEALETAREMDGMPWWNKPDMTTLKAIRITSTKSRTVEEA